MRKMSFLKYGLTALMMAFAMTLCYSCSSDDDEETNQEVNPPSNAAGEINGHAYVELAGLKWATENVGRISSVEAIAGPDTWGNEWGCYYYSQANARLAAESWSSTWKLPTEAQWKALINNCTWTWQNRYLFNDITMKGYKVSDKKDASKFIFLPVAGIYYDGDSDVLGQDNTGYYWSSDDKGYLRFFDADRSMSYYDPSYGMAVRPVSE